MLWEIEGAIEEAAGWCREAQERIDRLFPEDEDVRGVDWYDALNALSLRLGQIEQELRGIIPPIVREALERESEEMDEAEARADAASW